MATELGMYILTFTTHLVVNFYQNKTYTTNQTTSLD